jgi:hypothetical protein
LKCAQHRERAFSICDRDEDMIVVIRRHDIGADAVLRQTAGDRCRQSDGLEARMNVEPDALQDNGPPAC